MLPPLNRKLLLGFGLMLAFPLIVAAISFKAITLINSRKGLDLNSKDVIIYSNQVISDMQDIESAARGYVISGLDEFLNLHREKEMLFPADVKSLMDLVAGVPGQRDRADELLKLCQLRVEASKELIRRGRPLGDADSAKEPLRRGNSLMERVLALVREIVGEEKAFLRAREETSDLFAYQVKIILPFVILADLSLILVVYCYILEKMRRRRVPRTP